ncbi:unnamed protein product [Polarella glacialis]|uniref:Uncharacterized protein n=1 Tax=Polarella glacialis TaxID=89957 RepID=A0A813GY51_POLGL|nr:unnamed protein product [Polarella glacialis]
MARLKFVEETADCLVFKMGALAMIGQMALCILSSAIISAALSFVLRLYIGFLAFILCGGPGLIGVVCGFFGCANAREFVFTFDRRQGEFRAVAGRAQLVRPLSQITAVIIEQENDSRGSFGGENPPSFSLTLIFADGARFRCEAGVPVSGSPDSLRAPADQIRSFLRLPQANVPLLNVTRAAKEETEEEEHVAQAFLSRWVACEGLAPRMEPQLHEYDWIEPPIGVVPPMLPRPDRRGRGHPAGVEVRSFEPCTLSRQAAVERGIRANSNGATPIVVGRVFRTPPPIPQPRSLQVVLPEGVQAGQQINVMAPDGSQLQLTVPSGLRPGDMMTVQY